MRTLILLSLIPTFVLASESLDRVERLIAEPDLIEFKLDPSEYRDLEDYIDRARVALSLALEDGKSLGGATLRTRLLSGIEQSLRSSSIHNQYLIFRHILVRAQELDSLFNQGDAIFAEEYSASIILLDFIRMALAYHEKVDAPHLQETKIVSPDWVALAADQIAPLLRITALAPAQSRYAIIKRAVGWTAKTLNSSIHRRDYAETILKLAAMERMLEQDPNQLKAAMQLLVEVQSHLAPATELPVEPRGPAPARPPGEHGAGWNTPSLLITPFGQVGESLFSDSSNHIISMSLGLGTQGVWSEAQDGTLTGLGSALVTGDVEFSVWVTPDDWSASKSSIGIVFARSKAGGELGYWDGQLSGSLDVDVSANMFIAGGVFALYDLRTYDQLKDNFLALGWDAALPLINREGDILILAHFQLGTATDLNEDADFGALYIGGELVFKKALFAVSIGGGHWDGEDFFWSNAGDRSQLNAEITFPVKFLIQNGSLNVSGELLKKGEATHYLLGVSYEVQF